MDDDCHAGAYSLADAVNVQERLYEGLMGFDAGNCRQC